MQRVLVLFAHPALEKSRVNRELVETVRGLEGVTFHDLYESYPDFDVDVAREQELLSEHPVVVLHHPFYWYSTPPLVKQWEDLVLQHGWRPADAMDEDRPVILAGFGRFGNAVGRLLTANGIGTTILDNDSDRVDLLRRMGLEVFYGDATRLDLLEAAGAARARLLVLALDDPEKNLALVHTAKRHFPELTLVARANGWRDAYELLDAGVEHVFRETLDSSLRLGVETLRLLGVRAHRAHRAAQMFRRHDEESVRQLAGVRHDQRRYVDTARERIRHLEAMLRADAEERRETDAGWDVESLRRDFGGDPDTR